MVDGIVGTKRRLRSFRGALEGKTAGSNEVKFTASDSDSLQDKYNSLSSSKKDDIYLLAQLILCGIWS